MEQNVTKKRLEPAWRTFVTQVQIFSSDVCTETGKGIVSLQSRNTSVFWLFSIHVPTTR